jgi:hypothetical protein
MASRCQSAVRLARLAFLQGNLASCLNCSLRGRPSVLPMFRNTLDRSLAKRSTSQPVDQPERLCIQPASNVGVVNHAVLLSGSFRSFHRSAGTARIGYDSAGFR